LRKVKKLNSNESIGLIDAIDRINTPFTNEDIEFINGPTRKRKRKTKKDLNFEKTEIRPIDK